MPYPFRYSVLIPGAGYILQKLIKPLAGSQARSFLYSYELINFFAFTLLFTLFYIFLKMFFSDITSTIGLFLFLAVIPLSMSGVWPEVGVLNFLFYALGFILMFKSKDQFLPLVFVVGMLNDESIIFLMVFYIINLISNKKLYAKKSIIVIILSVISCATVYGALRWKFGFPSNDKFFLASENFDNISSIIQLWIAEAFMFIFLSVKAYNKSSKFFKWCLASLLIYIVLFFLLGNMNGFARFLPAYLILIPMSLQILTSESAVTKLKTSSNTV